VYQSTDLQLTYSIYTYTGIQIYSRFTYRYTVDLRRHILVYRYTVDLQLTYSTYCIPVTDLSRFDMKFLVKDIVSCFLDRKVIEHVLQVRMGQATVQIWSFSAYPMIAVAPRDITWQWPYSVTIMCSLTVDCFYFYRLIFHRCLPWGVLSPQACCSALTQGEGWYLRKHASVLGLLTVCHDTLWGKGDVVVFNSYVVGSDSGLHGIWLTRWDVRCVIGCNLRSL